MNKKAVVALEAGTLVIGFVAGVFTGIRFCAKRLREFQQELDWKPRKYNPSGRKVDYSRR